MDAPVMPRKLKQFVLKPTVFCYHRCPYCDLRQDYYRGMVADRKKTLPLAAGPGERRPNPGHMPPDMALRTIDEAAALGMEELQLSGGDPLLYPHLVEVIRAARKHPGVFVLMNSVGTGVTVEKAREIIEAGLGRGTSPSTPWTRSCTSGCAGCGRRCRRS
jgi:MoaA/NifB/PqqE/SkfB family radical SAM enzyme